MKSGMSIKENESTFNRAVQGAYAPGSIFKMVSSIAALENGVITENETIRTTGVSQYAHKPVCWIYTEEEKPWNNKCKTSFKIFL